ncbi:MAG TPA: nucleotide-binding protein [Candidatus Omnitrophota bacterium]|nr:nucleotide-binding protein [Candidatus Omnitrophota bacterium]
MSENAAPKNIASTPTKQPEEPGRLEDLKSGVRRPEKGGRVCITYGRDQIMNKQVVSLIREFGIDPIVMQDKTNSMKPIAQFYTEHPEISFAIAILSADDWVYPKNGKPKDALLYADQRVIFHLGFWIGHLGRNHVFALYYDQKSFRWPTEHFDVIYTPLDKNGLWKKELGRRLKESGIETTEK